MTTQKKYYLHNITLRYVSKAGRGGGGGRLSLEELQKLNGVVAQSQTRRLDAHYGKAVISDFFEGVHIVRMYTLQSFSDFSSMCVAMRSFVFRMGLYFVYLST